MERLTFEGDFCDIAQCRELPCPYNNACSQRKVWERLKAYEDTGRTPQQIKELAHDTTGPLHRKISEWIDAEQDGRLVVLPCGTDVELVRDGYAFKADHWSHTLTAFRDEPKNKSGKQIALFSTKEAEAALAQEGGTNEDSGGL